MILQKLFRNVDVSFIKIDHGKEIQKRKFGERVLPFFINRELSKFSLLRINDLCTSNFVEII